MDAQPVYQGQFGEFTITEGDRQSVIIYRSGLVIAALSFALGSTLALWNGGDPVVQQVISILFSTFCIGLAVSLLSIHIYMAILHRALQAFWVVGVGAAIAVAHFYPDPFAVTVYHQPITILGIGFVFAALTGLFFKEAFCFNRMETKLLTPLIPLLLLGHLFGFLPLTVEKSLLATWAVLFTIFALRKVVQPIPPDIGDKSVFDYLKQQQLQNRSAEA
jgi:uncharacterized integral membrane protein